MIFYREKQLQKKAFKILFPILLVFFNSIILNPINALTEKQEELISINDIQPGMKGIGKTVFSGIKIEEFAVEVIDIIQGSEVSYPYILVKLSGDRIDNNGGISAGMSGSPVYFEGKLAGAISHAWELSQHNLCLITPIHVMLTLFDYIDQGKQDRTSNTVIEDSTVSISMPFTGIFKKDLMDLMTHQTADDPSLKNNHQLIIDFQKIQTPLLANGFKGRAGEYVKNTLQRFGINLIQNISEYQDNDKELNISQTAQKVQPGSAIGVQLSMGDVSVIGIGTATYCQDNYVLAFGHPFLHHGSVSYLFSAVYIYHSFPNIVMPFKIGSAYQLLGEVIQDRNAGILARVNKFPGIVSCKITVNDLDQNIKKNSGVKVVPQKEIVQSIVPALLIQSMDNTLDRIGQGTANTKFGFRNAHTGEILYYENVLFSENDIAIEAGRDLNTLFDLLYYNFCEKIDLNEITIEVAIQEQNRSAFIKEAKLNAKDYYPGDSLEAQITITPFRLADEQRVANIKLPEDISAGSAVLIVRGGSSQEQVSDKTISQDKQDYLLKDWSGIKTYLEKKEKNNQIIVELILFNENEKTDLLERTEKDNLKDDLKVILDSDFVVDGYHEIFLNIKNKNENETE